MGKDIKKYIENTSIVLIVNGMNLIIGFIITIIIAKSSNPEVLGLYTQFVNIMGLIVIFTSFGMNNSIIKLIKLDKYQDGSNSILAFANRFVLINSVVASILFFVFKDYIALNFFKEPKLTEIFRFGYIAILFLSFEKLFDGIYRGLGKGKIYKLIILLFQKLFFVIGIVYLWRIKELSIKNIIIALMITYSFSTMILLIFYKRNLEVNKKTIRLKYKDKRKIILFSSKFIAISFIGIILSKIDIFMLGYFLQSSDVGVYAIISRISILAIFVLTASNYVLAKFIVDKCDNNEKLKEVYITSNLLINIINIPLVLTLIIFGDTVLSYFGEAYKVAYVPMIFLLLGRMISSLVGSNGLILNMGDNENFFLIDIFTMALVNFILNGILIPKFGILGASIATGLSIAIFNILKIYQVKKIRNFYPYELKDFKYIYGTIILALINIIIKFNLKIDIYNLILIIIVNEIFLLIISYYVSDRKNEIRRVIKDITGRRF